MSWSRIREDLKIRATYKSKWQESFKITETITHICFTGNLIIFYNQLSTFRSWFLQLIVDSNFSRKPPHSLLVETLYQFFLDSKPILPGINCMRLMNTIYFSVTSCNLPRELWFLQAGRDAKKGKKPLRPAWRNHCSHSNLSFPPFFRFSSVVNNPIIGNISFFVC